MFFTFIAIIVVLSRGDTLPTGPRTENPEILIDYSILTGCELNIQKKCIEVYGTVKNLVGTKNDTCEISKLINCFNIEKLKKECTIEDSGTVAYVDAYIKNVDVTKCMDLFGYTEVRELFKSASIGNEIEYRNVHRTYSSGDQDSYNDDLENGEDDEVSGESGSGHNNHVS